MSVYADTSFLVSIYSLDSNSSAAAAILRRMPLPIQLSALGEVEMSNAFALRIYRRELTLREIATSERMLQSDVEEGILNIVPIPAEAFGRAVRLARSRTPALGLRSLDILHVACALEIGASTFLTFDKNQRRLARLEGLVVA